MPSVLTPEQRARFDDDGYFLVSGFFSSEETGLLRGAMERDPAVSGHFYDRTDSEGLSTKMVTWNHPGDSVYGLAARSEKMVDTMEDLLGGEVYHYHSKLTAKEPRAGGAWEWHQDYGYWYHNGCLFPYMASAMIALDKSTRDERLPAGSERLTTSWSAASSTAAADGEQVGADLRADRRGWRNILEKVYCGDGAGRRALLPLQHTPPLRPEPLRPAGAGR